MVLNNDNIKKIQQFVNSYHLNHQHSNGSLKLYPDISKKYEWDNEANIERLCFHCGPGTHFQNTNLDYEIQLENLTSKHKGRSDVFIHSSFKFMSENKNINKTNIISNKTHIFTIVENKLCTMYDEIEHEINEATSQINNYIQLLDYSEKYYLNNEYYTSICIFNPIVFLSEPNNYLNYLNDKYSSQEDKFNKYGLLIFSLKRNQDSNEILSNDFRDSKINVIPALIELLGNLNLRSNFADKNNFTMDVKLLELYKLPLTNINPSSEINNPREYAEDSSKTKTRKNNILKTMEKLYFKDDATRTRGLGAKNRELAYNINETIMYNLPYTDSLEARNLIKEEYKFTFKDILIISTTNMSLIDGQHSTKAFIDLHANKNNDLHKIKIDKSQFIKKMGEYVFGLNFKGYNETELAVDAAINQNSIKTQSRVDETLLELRERIIKLANFYNGKKYTPYILNFNKSSYSSLLDKKQYIFLWAEEFPYVWGVLQENNFNIETFKKSSESKTTSSQSNGNYLRDSVDWCFEKERTTELKIIYNIISRYKSSKNYDDGDSKEKQTPAILLNNLLTYLKEIENKIDNFPKDIKQIIYSLMRSLKQSDETRINSDIEELETLLTNDLKINEVLLRNIVLILGKVKERVDDTHYKKYTVMIMWLLKIKFQIDNQYFENNLLSEQQIDDCFHIVDKHKLNDINDFETYINQKN